MRLFAALTPSAPAVEHLNAFLEPRLEAGPDLRWTDPDQWHVTLAFMAAVPERALEDVERAVAEAAATHPPVELRLVGSGAFPRVAEARVLWSGVTGELDPLARRVRDACSHAGGTPQGGRFHAHLTLARFRRPTEATRWLRVLDSYTGPSWTAREVSLISSHLGEGRRGRARHEVLSTAPLTGPPHH
jgi:2'-5' RNA ligase